jgi:hypothetical protein
MKVRPYFTILVYPFCHAASNHERKSRLQKLSKRWQPWWRRLDRDGLKQALDDTYFFLPYIREMLFPEAAKLPAGDSAQQVTRADQLARLSPEQLAEILSPDGVIRLTYEPELLEAFDHLQLEVQRRDAQGKVLEEFSAPFHICWVDVALFPQYVGFLMMKVELDEENPTENRINDFLYYVHLVHPPVLDWHMAHWRRTTIETPLTFRGRDLVDFLLQGLTAGPDELDHTIDALVSRLRHSGIDWRYSATEAGQVYGQVFHLYSYACLAEASSITDHAPSPDMANQPPSPPTESTLAPFASPVQRILYKLATCTQTAHPDYQPHAAGLKQLMEKGHIALWANWEGMALHDNVVFLGTTPTPFTRSAFPHNVEYYYFNLYLLSLYQKMRLSLMSGELMRRGADLHRNLGEARSLWDAFVMFRNHYWFAEVTLKPQGTELYRRFQVGLDVISLYEAVSDEVHALQEYYERQAERNIDAATQQLQQDMAENVAATRELQGRMTEHLNIVAKVQVMVEYIEIFLVSVYAAHLWHMFALDIGVPHLWVGVSVLGWAGMGAGVTAWLLKPWKHHQHGSEPKTSMATPSTISVHDIQSEKPSRSSTEKPE